jgi:small multidrug resistance pump
MKYLLVLIYILSSSVGMILIKKDSEKIGFNIDSGSISIQLSLRFIIGLLLYIISFLLWIIILREFKITYISPIVYGLVFVLISILSYFLLNDRIEIRNIIGFILIFLGVLISSFG